jgi:hypothetical protein
MQISVFTPSRPCVENDNNFDNQIPDAARRRGNPFWGFVGNMLGLEPEQFPASTGSLDWQLDAVARRDQRIVELNKPPSPAAAILQELGDHVAEAVKQTLLKVKKPTAISRATEWLKGALKDGPLPERQFQVIAQEAGIKPRTLKRAKEKARAVSERKGRDYWVWRLPFKRAKDVDGQ